MPGYTGRGVVALAELYPPARTAIEAWKLYKAFSDLSMSFPARYSQDTYIDGFRLVIANNLVPDANGVALVQTKGIAPIQQFTDMVIAQSKTGIGASKNFGETVSDVLLADKNAIGSSHSAQHWFRPYNVLNHPGVVTYFAPHQQPWISPTTALGDPMTQPLVSPFADPAARADTGRLVSPDGRTVWRLVASAQAGASLAPPHGPYGASMSAARGPMRKEAKRLSSRAAARFANSIGFNPLTEFRDLIRSLWKNIPAKNRLYWGNPTLARMSLDVLVNLGNIHFAPYQENYAKVKGGRVVKLHEPKLKPGAGWDIATNQVQDFIYGALGNLSGRGARNLQSPVDSGGRAVRAVGKGNFDLGKDPISGTLDKWGVEFARSYLGGLKSAPLTIKKSNRARIS